MKYSGQKAVNDWIKGNLFLIHEYAASKDETKREDLQASLAKVLKGKTKKIKIETTTKLGDWIRIDYSPSKTFMARFVILIDQKQQVRIRK